MQIPKAVSTICSVVIMHSRGPCVCDNACYPCTLSNVGVVLRWCMYIQIIVAQVW